MKKGDRVILTSGQYSDTKMNPRWQGKYGSTVGTVISVSSFQSATYLNVMWDNGEHNSYYGEPMQDLSLYDEILSDDLFEI